MKNTIMIIMFVIAILGCNNCFAQIEDPLNQNKKVHREWDSEAEEVISKKKKNQDKVEENNPVVNNVQAKPQSNVKINNSCPDKLTVELVSLVGNKSSQEVTITIRFTNHKINESMYLKNYLAFNEEGEEFSGYSMGHYKTLTDIPQKASWKIGQMLPSKNKKLTAISFMLGDCTIEMRDIPIDWK